MILKIKQGKNSWDFYANVTKIRLDNNRLIEEMNTPNRRERIENSFGFEPPNPKIDQWYNKQDHDPKEENKYQLAKIIQVNQNKSSKITNVAFQTEAFLLNDKGETIEKLHIG